MPEATALSALPSAFVAGLPPGRSCPAAYRYAPRVFDRAPDLEARTLFVAGGLYGNVEALQALLERVASEPGPAAIVFNGDFHWFDVDEGDFRRIGEEVARHAAIRGNVETEVSGEDAGAGCGCAYPADVSDEDVSRSNEILVRLRETARGQPRERERLAGLPMHLVARVGGARVGIVHGDLASLAGWGFAAGALDDPGHARWLENGFREARVDVFASSHTCLAATRAFDFGHGRAVVANNGAAGMPNFAGERFGLVTRIGLDRAPDALYGAEAAGAFVETLPLAYDEAAWQARFLASWPEASAAHRSYFRRISRGPEHARERARPAAETRQAAQARQVVR
ncbi:MAG: metallophosphoesterase [Burkholderiales bacterium]